MSLSRRRVMKLSAAAIAGVAAPAIVRAEMSEIQIGFWPIAAGLPIYAGVAAGVFAKAGLKVTAVKFASAQQVTEGMIAGRLHGSANGVASGTLGLAEITDPGLCRIIASNPSNAELKLDEFIVAKDSPFKTIADLKGKRIASGPGIQNVTLAKVVLEKNGYPDAKPVELPIGQHVPALVGGQIYAIYTLEPTGTLGEMQGFTRTLEAGVIARYALGDPKAPWFGGAACVTRPFLAEAPDLAKRYIAAYGEAIALVRKEPDACRAYLPGNTSIDAELAKKVPLPGFTLYNEFTESDLDYFQKFFDIFSDRNIFAKRVMVRPMMYHA
jgi:NitT/TauT family transport system substrate-binding protein